MANSKRIQLANYLLGTLSAGPNYVLNSSAFKNTANVTAANSATVARNTTTPLTSISDFDITLPNNTNGSVTWTLGTLDRSLASQNCELSFDYTASSIGSAVVAEVLQGSDIVVRSGVLPVASTVRKVVLNVPCGDLSSSTTIRIANTTGNSGTSAIKVANVEYGKARNIGSVAQPTILARAYFAKTASCAWPTTSSTMGDLSATSACPAPTVEFSSVPVSTADDNLPQITLSNIPAGRVVVVMTGSQFISGAGIRTGFAVSDGTTISGEIGMIMSASNSDNPSFTVTAAFDYPTAQSSRTFKAQARTESGTVNINNQNGANAGPLTFTVYHFPSASQQLYTPDLANPYSLIRYGGTPTFSTSSISDVTVSDSSFTTRTLVNGAAAPSTTNDFGIRRTLPAGLYKVIAKSNMSTFNNGFTTAGHGCIWSISDGTTSYTTADSARLAGDYPATHTVEGVFSYADLAERNFVLRVRATDASTICAVNANGTDAVTADTAQFEIVPITQSIPTPVLVGSVTSQTSGQERIERAIISGSTSDSTTAPSAGNIFVFSQSGSWISSVSRSVAGLYTVNFSSGIFSAAPSCSVTPVSTSTYRYGTLGSPISSSSIVVGVGSDTGTAVDQAFHLICMGPRGTA